MMETVYYGHIDKAEPAGDELFYLEFHCLAASTAYTMLFLPKPAFKEMLLTLPTLVITLINPLARIQQISPTLDIAGEESRWVILNTNEHNIGLPADLFTDEVQSAISISQIADFRPEQERILSALQTQVSMDDLPDASETGIRTVLETNSAERPAFVAVYNVGQGNCNAICNASCQPLLYFDLGGGYHKNKHTYPTLLNFCFSQNPPILLSHWDLDHIESARRSGNHLNRTWIVPRQPIGPVHQKFLLSLTGPVLVWPITLPTLSFAWGEVVLCTGPVRKKNHTGLALLTSLKTIDITTFDVALPADAAYTYVPNIMSRIFDGLVATHHGAEYDINNQPLPRGGDMNAIAYSYGAGNSYHHPRMPATGAHWNAFWRDRRDTVSGHIAMTKSNPQLYPPFLLACGGLSCNLSISQSY